MTILKPDVTVLLCPAWRINLSFTTLTPTLLEIYQTTFAVALYEDSDSTVVAHLKSTHLMCLHAIMWTPQKSKFKAERGIWNLAREPIFFWKELLESGKLFLISALLLLFFLLIHTQTHKIKQQLEDGSAAVLFGSSEKCCGKLKVFISEGKSRGGLRKPIHEKFHLKLMRYNSMISPNYIKLQGNYLSHCAGCSVTSMERSCCWWGWSAGGNRRRGRGALRLAWQSKQLLKD